MKTTKTKPCKHCNKDFIPDGRRITFCSRKCYKEYHGPKTYVKFCKNCDERFKTKNKQKQYCSKSCGRKYYRQKSLEDKNVN